eukprot:GFYU01009867.1.p1 GENE.GFYU01009867.1~~GFYU01009867.1.p1  ORF type:complete len:281 (-),score=67.10 GFYU01009867.1:95-823(-)
MMWADVLQNAYSILFPCVFRSSPLDESQMELMNTIVNEMEVMFGGDGESGVPLDVLQRDKSTYQTIAGLYTTDNDEVGAFLNSTGVSARDQQVLMLTLYSRQGQDLAAAEMANVFDAQFGTHRETVLECQRRDQSGEFTDKALMSSLQDPAHLQHINVSSGALLAKKVNDMNGVGLPDKKWKWNGEWTVDTQHSREQLYAAADTDGWQYSVDFSPHFPWSAYPTRTSVVRRRLWRRSRQKAT